MFKMEHFLKSTVKDLPQRIQKKRSTSSVSTALVSKTMTLLRYSVVEYLFLFMF